MAGIRERSAWFAACGVCCSLVACGAQELPIACEEAESTTERIEQISLDEPNPAGTPVKRRTNECTSQGEVISIDVKSSPYRAKGDGESDEIGAIQAAVDAAKLRAASIPGTCTVQVFLPAGSYHVTEGIFVPSRVSLKGESRSATKIIKSTEGSLIELRDRARPHCSSEEHISVSALTLEMRASLEDRSKPFGSGGHCIRSVGGGRHYELRDLRLNSCNFYGLGFQIMRKDANELDCRSGALPYEHITIDSVKIVRSGSDGIDFKQPDNAANDDVLLHDVCIGDIGWNDDDASVVAFDLAGNDLRLETVTHVNPVVAYDTGGVRTYVAGVRFRSGTRNVTNSVVENFQVQCVNRGVFFEGHDNFNITLRNGEVSEARRLDDYYGDGIFVRGSGHRTEGDVYVTDVSRYKLVDYGSGSSMSLSTTAPALYNPACDL
jgi:hypothetical protein